MDIRFGEFTLDEINNVIIEKNGYREMHGAEREMTILKTMGRGSLVLNDEFGSKVVEIRGILRYSDANERTTSVRTFVREMFKRAQPLVIQNNDDEFVYDGCYVTNTTEILAAMRQECESEVDFRLVIFCPNGFARSTTDTSLELTVDETPYTYSITINGDTAPEPVISIEFVDASTITDVTFTNQTTNKSIILTDLDLVDDDIIYIDLKQKTVKLNTAFIPFDGVFPTFDIGENIFQIAVAADSMGITEQQTSYNDDFVMYGDRIISQKFTADGTGTRSSIETLIKRISSGSSEVLYKDFSSDYTGFTVSGGGSGEFFVDSSGFNLKCDNGEGPLIATQNANLSAAGDGIRITSIGVQQGGNTGIGYVEYTDLTDYIRVVSNMGAGNTFDTIVSSSYYGSLNIPVSGNGDLKIVQVGSDIQVYWAGILTTTIVGKTIKVNSRVRYYVQCSGGTNQISSRAVYRIVNTNTNSDITVQIQTDATGEPSGTPVANGTLTIPASDVGSDSFSIIIEEFVTSPSLSDGVVYHLVLSQTGGDVNNYFIVKFNNLGGYAGGNMLTSVDDGANWTDESTYDLYFRIYGDVPASFELTTIISYFKSFFNVG